MCVFVFLYCVLYFSWDSRIAFIFSFFSFYVNLLGELSSLGFMVTAVI